MKELSIEEKAKRYDEIREKAQKWYDANTNEGYRGIFEDIFSELKESEDERIRKEIADIVKAQPSDSLFNGTKEKCLAWLEKQGEQKSQEEVVDNLHNYLYGEQKPAWSEEDEEIWNKAKQIFPESLNMQSGYVTGYIDAFKHFSLKKEWSEDDMKVIKEIIFLLKHYNSNETLTTVHSIEDMINWLKSLKDRVQPKQEWSEEDKICLRKIQCNIEYLKREDKSYRSLEDQAELYEELHFISKVLNDLKSPQSTWRPSDEQIYELTKAVNYYTSHGFPNKILDELLKQLKNL